VAAQTITNKPTKADTGPPQAVHSTPATPPTTAEPDYLELVRASRAAQGLPMEIENPRVLANLRRVLAQVGNEVVRAPLGGKGTTA
jgi:hypothetical protein